MAYLKISKTDSSDILPGFNFRVNEFHPNADNAIPNQSGFPDEFYLSEITVKGCQAIRSYYNHPVQINASGRTKAHNKAIGGASSSRHLLGQHRGDEMNHVDACDLDFGDGANELALLKDFHAQVLNGGPLVDFLKDLGINGIGLYDGFIHLDSRPDSFRFWDNRVSTKGDENFLQQYAGNIKNFIDNIMNPTDDGIKDHLLGLKKKGLWFALAIIIIAAVIWYRKRQS